MPIAYPSINGIRRTRHSTISSQMFSTSSTETAALENPVPFQQHFIMCCHSRQTVSWIATVCPNGLVTGCLQSHKVVLLRTLARAKYESVSNGNKKQWIWMQFLQLAEIIAWTLSVIRFVTRVCVLGHVNSVRLAPDKPCSVQNWKITNKKEFWAPKDK